MNVRYVAAAAARSAAGSGIIDHPHDGQKAALDGIPPSQCGQFTDVCGIFPELDNSASITLLSAGFANTIDLEGVAGGEGVVPASNLVLDLSHFLGEKFHRGAAFGTDHVVMAAAVVLVFIARDAVLKGDC